ncbi:MAG: MotA/TolQ/ExbB proton channel family protein [Trueperaceae bacterium]
MDLLISGGVVLVAIFALSVYAVYLFFVRLFKLSRERLDVEELMVRVNAAVRDRDLDLALEACEQHGGPVARVLQSALLRLPYGRQAVEAAFAEASLLEEQSLTRGLRPLATIAQVAPLLGLLGTVTGMIIAFGEISASGTGNPGLLAGGIGQALVTTAAGLIVAIPVLIGQNYLASRVDAILTEIDRRREELMANVVQAVAARKEPAAAAPAEDAGAAAAAQASSRAGAGRPPPTSMSPRIVPAGARPAAVPAVAAAGGSASLFAGDDAAAGPGAEAAADGDEDPPVVGRGGRLRVERFVAEGGRRGDGRGSDEAAADGDEPPDQGR